MSLTILIYDEGTEWTFSSNSGGRVISGPGSPHTGSNSIQGTNVGSGDNAVLTAPATLPVGIYAYLSLWLEPIGANWTNANSDFTFGWQDAAGNLVGNVISAKSPAYGFSVTNNTYQNLIIPIGDFNIPAGSAVQKLVATAFPRTSFSFLLDTITLIAVALVSTDPSTLANQSVCFLQCIPPGDQLAVQTYLLAVIAGLPTDQNGAQTLVNNARCFTQCIPPGDQLAVQNYILAQLAS